MRCIGGRSIPTRCVVSCQAHKPFERSKYGQQAEVATEFVMQAARMCSALYENTNIDSVFKEDKSPVTIADYAIQNMLASCLETSFGYPLIAEEDMKALEQTFSEEEISKLYLLVEEYSPQCATPAVELSGKDACWILDPIDGTRGFLKQNSDQFAIGLALVDAGRPVIGILGLPNWHRCNFYDGNVQDCGILLASVEDCGTWAYNLGEEDPKPVKVNVDTSKNIEEAAILISEMQVWKDLPTGLEYAPRNPASILKGCCGSLSKYAAVCTGSASSYIEYPIKGKDQLKVWDHAAGIICVNEAGGQVTDLSGNALQFNTDDAFFYPDGLGIVVSNGKIHKEILDKTRLGIERYGPLDIQ